MTLVRTVRALVVVLLALCAPMAHAQQHDANARLAYAQGREAYQAGKYDLALQKFRFCYTLSGEPALLYNISAALQNLNRPGDAADVLQQYLTARPADPQRAEIEARIANLHQAQALLDKEAAHQAQTVKPPALVFTTPPPGWMSDAEADHMLADIRAKERSRHRKLGLGLGIGLGIVAVGGIVVGVVCGTGHCTTEVKDYDYGKNPVTP